MKSCTPVLKEISASVTIPNHIGLSVQLLSQLLSFHGQRPWQIILSRKHYDELNAHYAGRLTCGQKLDKSSGRGTLVFTTEGEDEKLQVVIPFKPGLFTQFHYDFQPDRL